MSDKNMCLIYGIDDDYLQCMKDKRKEIIDMISELSPVKQQQIINRLDELIKITISAFEN